MYEYRVGEWSCVVYIAVEICVNQNPNKAINLLIWLGSDFGKGFQTNLLFRFAYKEYLRIVVVDEQEYQSMQQG